MNKKLRRLILKSIVFSVAGFVLLAGCSTTITPIRYYLIDPVPLTPLQAENKQSIQIMDFKIPQYLERYQLATRTGANQLKLSDDHQWAENLRKNLVRTLARNLSQALNTPDVGTPQNRSLSDHPFRLQVTIDQFDVVTNGQLVLAARYQIIGPKGDLLATKIFEQSASDVDPGSHGRIVRAMQSLFGQLSLQIAESLSELGARG